MKRHRIIQKKSSLNFLPLMSLAFKDTIRPEDLKKTKWREINIKYKHSAFSLLSNIAWVAVRQRLLQGTSNWVQMILATYCQYGFSFFCILKLEYLLFFISSFLFHWLIWVKNGKEVRFWWYLKFFILFVSFILNRI